jgi:class 3 adenylate cyclase
VVDAALAPLREKLTAMEGAGRGHMSLAGERKQVTVMYADISGFTPLSENLDPEAVRDLISTYLERLVPIIAKYEGTVDKFMGDRILLPGDVRHGIIGPSSFAPLQPTRRRTACRS